MVEAASDTEPGYASEEVINLLKEKVPDHSVPKYVDFVESIPRTYKGYVIGRDLREMLKKIHSA